MSEGFIIKKIGDVCDVIPGQSPKSKFYNTEGEGLPFYQGKKRFTEKYIDTPVKWTTNITKKAVEGDILMSVRAPVGPVNFATQNICIGRGLAAIRPKESIDQDYLFYFFLKNETDLESTKGAVFDSINSKQIRNIKIPIPALPEQKRIVAILDEAFEAIDQAKANIERNIQNAEELFQSKLNEVFSKRGEGWEEKKLKEVCVLQRGFDLARRLRNEGDVPLVSSSGFIDNHSESKVKAPGVVTGRSGSIGNVFYVEEDFWPLNTVLYIKEFHGNLEKYIYYLLRHFDLKSYSSGAGVPTLNRNFVHDEVVIINKDIHKQKEIVDLLDELESEIQYLIRHYESKLFQLEELKKSILQKAFSGELTAGESGFSGFEDGQDGYVNMAAEVGVHYDQDV